jgi:hypothetical protein
MIGSKEGRQVIWHRTPISPICIHLNSLESGKDDISSEANLQSLKTSRDSYIDLELYIVKIFEFYLVIQSF